MTEAVKTAMLDASSAPDYVRERGLSDSPSITAHELSGGVSNVVLGLDAGEKRWVLKQSLPQLKVAQEWKAKQERTLTEARALKLVSHWTPEMVPTLVDVDPARFVLIIERASDDMEPWKKQLLEGRIDPSVARALGELLAIWHVSSTLDLSALESVDDSEAFEQLRVTPFYRTSAKVLPEIGGAIDRLIEDMWARNHALVHGDFSPKNVLAGQNGVCVLDLEVAHRGDPDFDVAFLISHLIAKAMQQPAHREDLKQCAGDFVASYGEGTNNADLPTAVRHLGALLVSRVHGKSPLEYLSPTVQRKVVGLGLDLLKNPPHDINAVWQHPELKAP